jgi:hypothetical protein
MCSPCKLEKLNVLKSDQDNNIYLGNEHNELNPLLNAIYYLKIDKIKEILEKKEEKR